MVRNFLLAISRGISTSPHPMEGYILKNKRTWSHLRLFSIKQYILHQINGENVHSVSGTGIRTQDRLIIGTFAYPLPRLGLPPLLRNVFDNKGV